MKPNVREDYSVLADTKHAVNPWLAVGVVSPIKEQGHDHKRQVQLDVASLVGVTPLALILHLGPQVETEEHVALRAQYENDESRLVEPEVFF